MCAIVWYQPTPLLTWSFQHLGFDCDWNTQELAAYLGVIFPEDAIDITLESNTCGAFHVDLNFKTQPQSAMQFADGICDGILHSGYNPFTAITDPLNQNAIVIDFGFYSYYSYSVDTPTTQSGNICMSQRGHYYRILVDTSNRELSTVRFNIPFACNNGEAPIPCANGFGTPVWTPNASPASR